MTASPIIRVMVVEDNFYTRLGTLAFLRAQPDIEVVGEATDGEQALALVDQLCPDVILLDLRMPRMNGMRVTATLRHRSVLARVLVLTHHVGDDDIAEALRAGADGYLTKEAPGSELVAAVRAVHAGVRYLPPEIVARLSARDNQPQLTHREREVLQHIAEGASNRDIATALRLSERTVGVYVSRILSKLGAQSRTEAAAIGTRRGIVGRDDSDWRDLFRS
jgi:two-component system NarL family response regulator